MRTIQEIFDVVIDGGFYGIDDTNQTASGFMCSALENAYHEGVITAPEIKNAHQQIGVFIGNRVSLIHLLAEDTGFCGIYSSYKEFTIGDDPKQYTAFELCTNVYRNWDKRHEIKQSLKRDEK